MSGAQVTHTYTPAGHNEGGDPFTTEAAPPASAPPAPPPPAAPPPAPSVWDRLGALFGRKQADARTRVLRTFLRIERDKKPLDDRALEAFAVDLREAGIGETELSEWRQMLGRLAAARAAKLRIEPARAAMEAAQKRLADIELAQLDLQAQHARALETVQYAGQGFHSSSAPIEQAAGVADKLAEIFPGESFN